MNLFRAAILVGVCFLATASDNQGPPFVIDDRLAAVVLDQDDFKNDDGDWVMEDGETVLAKIAFEIKDQDGVIRLEDSMEVDLDPMHSNTYQDIFPAIRTDKGETWRISLVDRYNTDAEIAAGDYEDIETWVYGPLEAVYVEHSVVHGAWAKYDLTGQFIPALSWTVTE